MYVKRLTLKGFKSFAHATTFEFEPGVTAVVGPNGSGKSNIVDALAWVMGEQGAKTLRGGKMEDVIFAGTAKKGPLGRAQVELTIDNTDGALPIEYTEVTISRTLFRNGGSEYAINGQSCRLLDVQELLSDSGLGREMHVIVSQGQLDQVLRASPEERRGFIEEAAGILKHRRRKERTVRKLDAMEANLQRVSDLTAELRRQLKPLGRQAEIARSAQQIQAEVRDATSRLLAAEIVELDTDLGTLATQRQALENEQGVLRETVAASRSRQTELEATTVSDELERSRAVVHRLESAAERFRSLRSIAEQRVALLSVRPQTFDLDVAAKFDQADSARSAARELAERATELSTALDEQRAATREAFDALQAVDAQIAEQAALISRHELRRSALANAVEVAAGKVEAAERQVESQGSAVQQATERRDQRAQALAEATAAEQTAEPTPDGSDTSGSLTTGLDAAYRAATDRLEAAERALTAARDLQAKATSEADSQQARAAALAMALESRDGSAQIIHAETIGVRGRVADALQVQAGFEAAVAAALGALTDALLVDSSAAGAAVLGDARAGDLGQVTGVVAEPAAPETAGALSDRPTLPPGVAWAPDVAQGPSGVLARLAHTVIVREKEVTDSAATVVDPVAVLDALPAGDWQVVTPEGDVIGRALVRGGGDAGQSRLQLLAQRDEALRAADEARASVASASARIDVARDERDARRAERDQALAELRAADARAAETAKRLGSLRAQVDSAEAELARLTTQAEQARTRLDEATDASEQAHAALASFDAEPQPLSDPIDRQPAFDALEAARAHEMEVRVSVETARERAKAEQRRAETLQRDAEQSKAQAEAQAREQAIRSIQLERAEHVQALLPDIMAHIGTSLQQARLTVAEHEVARNQQHGQLRELRERITEQQHQLELLAERAHGIELREHEQRVRRDSAAERVRTELNIDVDVLIAESGPHLPIPVTGEWADADETVETVPYDHEQQRLRLVKAQRALSRLGRVNPLALEEFAALEERYNYMNDQLVDLRKTRADLIAISDELDEKMQSIFTEAFDDTQRAFDEIFPVLFPGGRGSLTLTDPEHPLTTGIAVHIRPAGKKIDRLSLLSGGERSLAAVALLVAIFIARPSPFYIMDEVEAALDDANLGRLLSVFERLRRDSQLIVITHQKRTMEIADALYGVSMRQDGVSAVVGQRMEHDEYDADHTAGEGDRAADDDRRDEQDGHDRSGK
ncbi:chromosome segregation protein SMC [Pseudoclavibacter sp. CFCC 13611]|uniref:chromosome segregation protein SMC n=1 Tax=Pseudoclavibacter sp. CFCC 13611 TaxID=2615178 RepID=UPI00130113B5|nr:chromosome segregation protein SMC [Pseudoclavibacter sp. CFCC 13611]